MTFSHGKDSAVYLNGYNLAQYINKASVKAAATASKTTTLGLESDTYIRGLKSAQFTASGLYDGAASASHAILNAAFQASTDSEIAVYPTGDTTQGDPVFCLTCQTVEYSVDCPVEDIVTVTLTGTASGDVDAGIALHPLAARTTGANGSTRDDGAASTAGAAAMIHVTAFTGTSLDVIIEESENADMSAASTLITFTQATGITSERKSVTGSVKRYVRAVWSGTFTSVTFAVAWARK